MSTVVCYSKQSNPTKIDVRVPDSVEFGWRTLLCAGLFAQSVNENIVGNPLGPWHMPRVASGIILVNMLVFLKPGGWRKSGVAVTPFKVVEKWQIHRLLLGTFVHQDFLHLVINMRSLLDNMTQLEEIITPRELVVDLASLTVVTHTSFVGLSWFQHKFLGLSNVYKAEGSVGFTSVNFSLQILSSYLHLQLAERREVVPPQYISWLNLAFIQLFYHGGFQSQFCGILAGLFRVFVPGPFLWIRSKVCALFGRKHRRRSRQLQVDEEILRPRRSKSDLCKHALWAVLAIAVNLSIPGLEPSNRASLE